MPRVGSKGATSAQGFGFTSGATLLPPNAPTIGTASLTAGNTIIVSFTPPSPPGTTYTVTSSPDGITASGASSPIAVSGLTQGTTYTFTVTATNAAGTSPPSSASNAVTSYGTPGGVAGPTSITALYRGVSVTFSPATDFGGSTLNTYQLTDSTGNTVYGSASSSPITVSNYAGFAPGTTYLVYVVTVATSGLKSSPVIIGSFIANSSTVATSYSSSSTFTVPSGVSTLYVESYGAGGNGNVSATAPKGGGGGAYSLSQISVSAGQTVYIGVSSSNSWVNKSANIAPSVSSDGVLAVAGSGGASGGAGGASSSGIGSLRYSGGNGGAGAGGSATGGGGGGAAASYNLTGGAGGQALAGGKSGGGGGIKGAGQQGQSTAGGKGGLNWNNTQANGATSSSAAVAGTNGGGGGGGTSTTNFNGAAGGNSTGSSAANYAGGGGGGGGGTSAPIAGNGGTFGGGGGSGNTGGTPGTGGGGGSVIYYDPGY